MSWSRSSAAIYVASGWAVRAVRLHLLWLGLVFAGGVMLGVFPASFALLIASRGELRGENGSWPLPTMWRNFRRFFLAANLFGYGSSFLALVGVLDFGLLHGKDDLVDIGLRIIATVTTLLLAVWIPNAWAALATWEVITPQAVRMSALCAVAMPLRTLLVSGGALAVAAGCYFLPAGALIAGSALMGLVVSGLAKGMYAADLPAAPAAAVGEQRGAGSRRTL